MLPLLALIPGLLWTGAKYVGPILAQHADQITPLLAKVLSNSPTGKKIVDAFESVLGHIDEVKKDEFTLELDSMLGQIDLNKIDAASPRLFNSGWRPFFAWGIGANIVLHYTVVNLIDICNAIFGTSISQVVAMDHMALSLMSGLLGLYMAARTLEKHSGNA